MLQVKLRHIDDWNKARNSHALKYNELLGDVKQIKCPKLRPDTFHIFHLYVIRAERRDDLAAFLKTKGVATGIHYPTALPLMPAYRYLKHQPADFPSRLRMPGPDPFPTHVSGTYRRTDRLRR